MLIDKWRTWASIKMIDTFVWTGNNTRGWITIEGIQLRMKLLRKEEAASYLEHPLGDDFPHVWFQIGLDAIEVRSGRHVTFLRVEKVVEYPRILQQHRIGVSAAFKIHLSLAAEQIHPEIPVTLALFPSHIQWCVITHLPLQTLTISPTSASITDSCYNLQLGMVTLAEFKAVPIDLVPRRWIRVPPRGAAVLFGCCSVFYLVLWNGNR